MKYITMLVLLFALNTAQAIDSNSVASAGFSTLTDIEKTEVLQIVAQKAANKGINSSSTVKSVDEWVTLGERVGKGFAGAARELGVAANEFSSTPVGKWVAFLIFWKLMGATAIHIVFGLLFMIVGIGMLVMYKNSCVSWEIMYDTTKKNIFGNHPIIKKERTEIDDSSAAVLIFGTIATFGVTIFTIFSGL